MTGRSLFSIPAATLAIFAVSLFTAQVWAGTKTEKRLHAFTRPEGSHPLGITFGPDGAIYGSNVIGGAGGGTVYKLALNSDGKWVETTLISFGGSKGVYPNPVSFDSEGNIFGTLEIGPNGCGAVFELTPGTGGAWNETILHNLSCAEGLYPESPLTRDSAGNLYGLAWGGGAHGDGTVFELSPVPGGGWTFKLIHSFNGEDGAHPQSAVVIDAAGNLFGTALCGGLHPEAQSNQLAPDCGGNTAFGTVWELSPQTDGTWTERIIHRFDGHNGANPSDNGQLIFDAAGNLYGTTHNGGLFGVGTVYKLSPRGDGTWSSKVLHSFGGKNGIAPSGGVIADAEGNLYGECFGPGSYLGVTSPGETGGQLVYKLSPNENGTWTETVLQRFNEPQSGGPAMGLIMDGFGDIFGTTWMGGKDNNGTVFEITP